MLYITQLLNFFFGNRKKSDYGEWFVSLSLHNCVVFTIEDSCVLAQKPPLTIEFYPIAVQFTLYSLISYHITPQKGVESDQLVGLQHD